MIKEGKKSAGIMYSTKDTFMSLVSNSFKKTFESQGGKVQVESFNYDDKDFRTQLLKLKVTNVEGLVLLGHDEVGLIMKQARELSMKQSFYTTGTITSPVAQELAKGAAEGTVFALWDASADNAQAKNFVNSFVKLVGRGPIFTLTTHPAYDTVKILADVVLPEVSSVNAKDIKAGLLKVSNYQGATGLVTINKMGAHAIPEFAYKLISGAPVKI
jgi:branched-chain amino acid transport system substrate-binding protein